MVRHIVMWKLDDSYSDAEKKEKINSFGARLMKLIGEIPEIVDFEVNYNSSSAPDSNFDLVLDSSFASWEDLEIYQKHREHVSVVEFAKSFKKQRSCIDFDF